jgi:hypothetical protein
MGLTWTIPELLTGLDVLGEAVVLLHRSSKSSTATVPRSLLAGSPVGSPVEQNEMAQVKDILQPEASADCASVPAFHLSRRGRENGSIQTCLAISTHYIPRNRSVVVVRAFIQARMVLQGDFHEFCACGSSFLNNVQLFTVNRLPS